MKKFHIAATALAVALCVLPFATACANDDSAFKINGKSFNVADYALPIEEASSLNVQKAYTQFSTKDFALSPLNYKIASARGNGEHAYEYQLYDMEKDRTLMNGKWYESISGASYVYDWNSDYVFFQLRYTDENYRTAYDYCGPTGELLTTDKINGNYGLDISRSTHYGDSEMTYTYQVSYYVNDGGYTGEYKTLYFAYSRDNEGNTTWKEIDEEKYSNYYETANEDSGYKVGDALGLDKQSIVDKDDYADYIYSDYSYSVVGDTIEKYTFYHGDTETGSVSFNGMAYGFLGKYFYFAETNSARADAKKGYNYEYTTPYGGTIKGNLTVYRYNFVEGGKKKEVKTDFLMQDFTTLYNYKTNDFDRAVVSAVKFENGVAVDSSISATYTLILDDECKVCADISSKDFSYNFYKLSDNRFISGRLIFDGNLDIVAQLPGSYSVWQEQQLLSVYTGSGNLFIDYDGKVVIPPVFSARYIIGDAVIGYDYTVYTKANPNGTPVADIVSVNEDEYLSTNLIGYGILVKTTPVVSDYSYTYTHTFYDLSGRTLGTVSGTNSSSVYASYTASRIYIAFTVVTNAETAYKTVVLG